jgi:hypothetical protein
MVKNKFLNLFVNVEVRGGIYRYISNKIVPPPPLQLYKKLRFYSGSVTRIRIRIQESGSAFSEYRYNHNILVSTVTITAI